MWEEDDDEDWEEEWSTWEKEAEEKQKCKNEEWKAYCTEFDENASNDCYVYYSYNGCGKKHECLHIEDGEEINCIAELKNKDFWNSIEGAKVWKRSDVTYDTW